MKDHEPHREIEDLLRADKPRVIPPPDLEARILSAIVSGERSRKHRFWSWLLLPAAAAIGIMMLRPVHQPPAAPVTRIEPPHPTVEVKETVVETKPAPLFENPLEREAIALRRDAKRAGHFLVNCLPSLDIQPE